MAERGVDDSVRRDAEHQFARVDSRQQFGFRQQTVVRCVIQFEDSREEFFVFREASQNGRATIGKLSGDQSMSVAPVDCGSAR